MPLAMLNKGENAYIRKIEGGRTARGKLTGLGLISGKKVTMYSENSGSGPLIVGIDNNRIALGRGMAHKILVEGEGSDN